MADYSERVCDFLTQKKGGIDVILLLDIEDGNIQSEIQEQTLVSENTISDRLTKARELGLVETIRSSKDHPNSTRYKLTPIGRLCRVVLESVYVNEAYYDYLEAANEIEDGLDKINEWFNGYNAGWRKIDRNDEFELPPYFAHKNGFPGENVRSDFKDFITEDDDDEHPLASELNPQMDEYLDEDDNE